MPKEKIHMCGITEAQNYVETNVALVNSTFQYSYDFSLRKLD